MPDPFAPVVLCSEPECQRELTRPECHDFAEHGGRCDDCYALEIARAEFALPVPPRAPALSVPPAAPPVPALPVFATARERTYFLPERVPCGERCDASRETIRVRGAA